MYYSILTLEANFLVTILIVLIIQTILYKIFKNISANSHMLSWFIVTVINYVIVFFKGALHKFFVSSIDMVRNHASLYVFQL